MNLTYHGEAANEICQATEWYDQQRSGLGSEYRRAVMEVLESVVGWPDSFARYEFITARRWPNIRRAIVKRFSQVVVFDVRENEVHVLAVYHSSRKPNYWFHRLKPDRHEAGDN